MTTTLDIDAIRLPAEQRAANARLGKGEPVDECFVCGRGLTERGLERATWIEHTTSGRLVAVDDLIPSDSQGCFPIGTECARKVPAIYRHKGVR